MRGTQRQEDLKLRGAIDVREAVIDASFAPAKKGLEATKNLRPSEADDGQPWECRAVRPLAKAPVIGEELSKRRLTSS
jgi:hypothetical protein